MISITFDEAIKDPCWSQAMKFEMESIWKNIMYTLSNLPQILGRYHASGYLISKKDMKESQIYKNHD
jgi:hypothetical protein